MAWFRFSGTALLVVCLLLGAAHASSDADRAKAREHFVAAKRAFELGRYDEAIKGYEEAYRLVDEPALLYNIGQAHRLAGHHAEALRAYKNFLMRSPDTKNRDEVDRKIAQLEKVIEEARRTQNQPPDTTIDPKPQPEPSTKPIVVKQVVTDRPRKPLLIAGGVTLSVGVAALGAGAACALLGSQTKEKLRRDSVAGNEFNPQLESRGKLYNGLMGGMLAVGVVAVATGAALVAIGMKPSPKRAWLIVPAVDDRQVGLVGGGRF